MAPKKNYRHWHKIAIGFTAVGDYPVNEQCLRDIFQEFGTLADVVVRDYYLERNIHFVSDPHGVEATGFAFLYFADAEAAMQAVAAINQAEHDLYLNYSKESLFSPLSQNPWVRFSLLDPHDPRLKEDSRPVQHVKGHLHNNSQSFHDRPYQRTEQQYGYGQSHSRLPKCESSSFSFFQPSSTNYSRASHHTLTRADYPQRCNDLRMPYYTESSEAGPSFPHPSQLQYFEAQQFSSEYQQPQQAGKNSSFLHVMDQNNVLHESQYGRPSFAFPLTEEATNLSDQPYDVAWSREEANYFRHFHDQHTPESSTALNQGELADSIADDFHSTCSLKEHQEGVLSFSTDEWLSAMTNSCSVPLNKDKFNSLSPGHTDAPVSSSSSSFSGLQSIDTVPQNIADTHTVESLGHWLEKDKVASPWDSEKIGNKVVSIGNGTHQDLEEEQDMGVATSSSPPSS